MPQEIHTIEMPDGSLQNRSDRLIVGLQTQVANGAGGGAGLSVTVAVTFGYQLPKEYAVFVNPGQDATWYVADNSKTATGFTVTLEPRLAANTLAAGAIDVMVVG